MKGQSDITLHLAPLHPPCGPLAVPQPDEAHPLLIASACESTEATYRQPPWLTGSYHPTMRLDLSGPLLESLAGKR
jgi:hypothetical protein